MLFIVRNFPTPHSWKWRIYIDLACTRKYEISVLHYVRYVLVLMVTITNRNIDARVSLLYQSNHDWGLILGQCHQCKSIYWNFEDLQREKFDYFIIKWGGRDLVLFVQSGNFDAFKPYITKSGNTFPNCTPFWKSYRITNKRNSRFDNVGGIFDISSVNECILIGNVRIIEFVFVYFRNV